MLCNDLVAAQQATVVFPVVLNSLAPSLLLKQLPPLADLKQLYVAYSGGVDSHVLLHLASSCPEILPRLTAVYVHHGLQAVADDWAAHCAAEAQRLGINFQCLEVNAKADKGESPEEAARDARYQALGSLLATGDVLLLAQHQDDQLETVLLQLFRGAGLAGLSGMPQLAPLGLGHALRPLLAVSKADILTYAQQHQLQWVEDPSNKSSAFDRNFLRNEVLPLLTQRWPALATTVSRAGKHCAAAQTELQRQTAHELKSILPERTSALDLSALANYSEYQQRLLLRQWLQQQGLRMPAEAQVDAIFSQVIQASADRDPELQLQGVRIRRFRAHLHCLPVAEDSSNAGEQALTLWPKDQQTLQLHDGQVLSIVRAESGIDIERWQQAVVTVGYRQGGEKIALPGRVGHHRLKKLLQEAAVPTWMRDTIPLIYLDGELAAVGDRWISQAVWIKDASKAIKIEYLEQSSCTDIMQNSAYRAGI